MGYSILLFDLDDTLLDFGANEADSLDRLFRRHGYVFSGSLYETYHSINKSLWAGHEEGRLLLEEVLNSRFAMTMRELGETVDGGQWEREYRELLGNGSQLIEGAFELCSSLSQSHRLFAITNGVARTQAIRLQKSGLYGFFEDIFDSQSIGFQKPMKGFFDYVKSHIRDFDISEALVIGDSPGTDIKGGMMAGIDTCWVNLKSQSLPEGIRSTYTIASLDDLRGILAK